LKKIEIKKGHVLQKPGDLNTKGYQVKSGLLRSYSIDDKGKEHIFLFASEGWIMADHVSPTTPADLYIDALEDSILIEIIKNENADHDVKKLIGRIESLQKRVISLMSASAIERYEHFISKYPDIVQRVPQKMIASYLGVTPETLSAAKKDWLQK